MSSSYDPQITPEMRARYLTRREADIATLEAALSANDFTTMQSIAHQIKGNAATFDYHDLERLAVTLEEQACANTSGVAETIAAIKAWLVSQPKG